jgi:hypothetical protein
MVYGQLAVAGLHRPESKTFGAISVDYTKSVSQVFIDAAVYIYTSSRSLNLLLGVELKDPSRRRQDLPSWVPDWSLDSSNILQPMREGWDQTLWQLYMRNKSRLFYLESPPVLVIEVMKQCAVDTISRCVIPSYDTIFKLESEIYESAIAHLKASSRPFYTRASARTFDDINERCKSVEETYRYVQQAMYSFWRERLGETLLDVCLKHRASVYEMMPRPDQYESLIVKRPEPFFEVFLKRLLSQQMEEGFEFCGRLLALIAKRDEGEDQEERLIAVPEATRSGDVIYWTLQEDKRIPYAGGMPIVLRPCRDEVSAAEDIDIAKRLRDKGCNFLRNDILHGRFFGICPIWRSYLSFLQPGKVSKQVIALH